MKINKKRGIAIGAALGVAAVGLAVAAPAQADPSSNGYVIVGSDTLQDAVGALANGTAVTGVQVRTILNGKVLSSYDAFPNAGVGSVIQTKPFGPAFLRPSGSGNGQKALSASVDPANHIWSTVDVSGQIDASRSSGNLADVGASGPLHLFPFGHDAVSYAIKGGSSTVQADIDAVSALTQSEITEIYTTNPATKTYGLDASHNLIDSTAGTIVVSLTPRLPQLGSGTREFFLTVITGNKTGAAAGVADYSNTTVQENTAASLTPGASEIQIIPFSAASYIAQNNLVTITNNASGITLGHPDGLLPYTGSAPTLVPDAITGGLYNSTSAWGRDTYIIVPEAKLTTDTGIAQMVDPTRTTSLTYWDDANSNSNTAKAVKLKFGFTKPIEALTGHQAAYVH